MHAAHRADVTGRRREIERLPGDEAAAPARAGDDAHEREGVRAADAPVTHGRQHLERHGEQRVAREHRGGFAEAAVRSGCRSVAFTYNDPVIFLEYAVDVAQACRARGIRTVAVSAGYISAEPRAELFRHMDAANIDLKGFTEGFYRNLCSGRLAPVLETLEYLVHETDVWLEITTLLMAARTDEAHDAARRFTDFAEAAQPGRAIGEVLLAQVLLAKGDAAAAAELLRPAAATLERTGYWCELVAQATISRCGARTLNRSTRLPKPSRESVTGTAGLIRSR